MRIAAAIAAFLSVPAALAQTPTAKPNIVQAVVRASGLQARVMWMDATANLDNLNTRGKVADVMERCRRSGINTVVVDVKPLIGEVLYPSKLSPRLTTYRGKNYDPNFDVLAAALEEGQRRGLKVYAAVNVFSEGHKLVGRGPAYQKTDWQSITYVPDRSIVTEEGGYPVSPIVDPPRDDQPPADTITVVTPASGGSRPVRAGETYTLLADSVVQATASADAVMETSVPIPENGVLLVGAGSAGTWMADRLRPGVRTRWEVIDRLVPIAQAATERVSVFVNPILPEARAHELGVIREIAQNYPVDGMVFDRMRYASLSNDFSALSRRAFEQWAGVQIQNWPADIFQYSADPTQEPIRGPYFKQWLEWRARNLQAFAREATETVRAARPSAKCAVYVGSWYPVYYGVGVNWASDEYNAGYDWMTDTYHQTGYAPMMDWLCTGTYYAEPFRAGARQAGRDTNATVEAAAALSTAVVADAAFVYGSINVPDYSGRPAAFMQAIQASVQESQGVMLFDLVYVIQNNLWGILEQTFNGPAIAPHDVPELLARIRDVRAILPPAPVRESAAAPQDWRLVVPE